MGNILHLAKIKLNSAAASLTTTSWKRKNEYLHDIVSTTMIVINILFNILNYLLSKNILENHFVFYYRISIPSISSPYSV